MDCPLAMPVSAPRLPLVKADAAAARTAPRVLPWLPVDPAGTTTFKGSPAAWRPTGVPRLCSGPASAEGQPLQRPRLCRGPAATGKPPDDVPVHSELTKPQAAFMPR